MIGITHFLQGDENYEEDFIDSYNFFNSNAFVLSVF